MSDNCRGAVHTGASLAAHLSAWIYVPPESKVDENLYYLGTGRTTESDFPLKRGAKCKLVNRREASTPFVRVEVSEGGRQALMNLPLTDLSTKKPVFIDESNDEFRMYKLHKDQAPKWKHCCLDYCHPSGDRQIQMAAFRTGEGKQLYIVFKGSDLNSFIQVANMTPVEVEDTGVMVHGGLWRQLEQPTDVPVWCMVKEEVAKCEDLQSIVLCGHSFGGACAVLMALKLLLMIDRKELPEKQCQAHLQVLTFGAPQVIADPDFTNPTLQRLHGVVRQYINRWDPVPRLPSLWMYKVHLLPEGADSQANKYGHVGQLFVLKRGSRWASRICSQYDLWVDDLGRDWPRTVSTTDLHFQHQIEDEYLMAVARLDLEWQPAPGFDTFPSPTNQASKAAKATLEVEKDAQ